MLLATTGMTARELIQVHNGLCQSDQWIDEWKASKQALVDRIEALATTEERRELANSTAMAPFTDNDVCAEETPKKPRVKDMVLELAANPLLTMQEIADAVTSELGTSTTARSCASVVCVFNKTATDEDKVPARIRRPKNAD